jgi:uncharacterized protein YegP (UPF0339 family)
MILKKSALAALVGLSLSSVACVAETEPPHEVEETSQDLVSRSAKFETFQGLDGQWYFHVLAGNGQKVLRSEGYTTLASAKNGIESVLANGADVRNYDVRQASNGEFYFDLKARNGQVIGTSQFYASKWNAERGVATVRSLVGAAQKTIQAAPHEPGFELFTGADGLVYFRLRANNGEIVLVSEGYTTKASAEKGIASVKANGASVSNFEVFEAADGRWALNLVAANGEVIARGETYVSKWNATRAASRIAELLRGALTTAE